MNRIYFIYDSIQQPEINPSEIFKDVKEIEVIIYDKSYTDESRKARMRMAKYAARELPFMDFVRTYETEDRKEKEEMLYVSYGEVNKVIDGKHVNDLIKEYYECMDSNTIGYRFS